MASKKKYYELDEIGFIGTQENKTAARVKKDIEQTVQFIKTRKSGKVIPFTKRTTRAVSKTTQVFSKK